MNKIHIIDKLKSLGVNVEDITLGDFDYIGEITAKKVRDRNHPLWKTSGAFFRPNYERGILIHYLIKHFNVTSYLEIGFGRGYSSICAARALYEQGVRVKGAVTTIDPNFDKEHIEMLSSFFPQEWLSLIQFIQGYSQSVLSENKQNYDFIYIDGDHRLEAVEADWNLTKDKWNKILLFDDYNLEVNKDIQCSFVIDKIDDPSKELIIMDRRIFVDDRKLPDDQIHYGQVLLSKS